MPEKQTLTTMCFDIESTALEATYGRILCIGAKFSNEKKPRLVSARWLKDEPGMLKEFVKWWDEADIVAGWNSRLFDLPMLNARLMRYGMLPLAPKKHIDLMWQQRKLRFRGSRLDGASKDLQTKAKKFEVDGDRWPEAAEGQLEAQELIAKHCRFDVLLTEEMFIKLKPLITVIHR